ncbi:MAG: DUF3192 domain-containing protein [Colwellia sp.]|nr:DUF3192 domain-containing protein [Colwellia sp.]
MNKKVVIRILIALAIYGVFVTLVVNFYDDSPADMAWGDRESFNRQYIGKLSLKEFNFDQAIKELGSPDITEAKKVDDSNFQVMFYRTQHVKSDGFTTQDECTALLFKNGSLIAIGKTAYQQFQQL